MKDSEKRTLFSLPFADEDDYSRSRTGSPWLLEIFGKNNSEMGKQTNKQKQMGTHLVARQVYQKKVQHYWVNIVKQQVTGEGGSYTQNTWIQPMEAALNQITFLTQAQVLLGIAIGEHKTQQNAEVENINN